MQKPRTKTIIGLLLASSTIMLSGCATMGIGSDTESSSGSFWSSLSPFNWFGSSLKISSSGVGNITQSSPMVQSVIDEQLDKNYRLRSGMQTEQGEVITVFQAMDDTQVKLEISGPTNGTVTKIIVNDDSLKTEWGTKIGDEFSSIYQRAFGACHIAEVDETKVVDCAAPQSRQITYRFSGKWQGPEELMPSDDVLKDWKVSQIIWRK